MKNDEGAIAAPRIGLVLSGGGVRGAFQAGIIRTLLEAGVRFDAIAGSSVGALNAVLASAHNPALLDYWATIPAALFDAAAPAQKKWEELVEACVAVKRRAYAAGWRHGHRTWSRRAGQMKGHSRARTELAPLLARYPDGSPLFPTAVARHMRKAMAGAAMKCPVYVTLSALEVFGARELRLLAGKGSTEISSFGRYEVIREGGEGHDLVMASMALPVLFGRRNNLNPTPFRDGGLYDNVPVKALSHLVKAGELDLLLVIDVASTKASFTKRQRSKGASGVPVLYVNLAAPRGIERLLEIVDLRVAAKMHAKGLKHGRRVVRQWFSPRAFPRSGRVALKDWTLSFE